MMVLFSGRTLQAVNCNLSDKEGGGWDASHWFDAKPELKEKNPLMNLPYIIVGEEVVSQSNACMLALGRKLNMLGSTEAQLSECEQLLCEVMDLRDKIIETSYIHSAAISEDSARALITDVSSKNGCLTKLELWLTRERITRGFTGHYLVGDKASAPDFHLFEMLDQYSHFARYFNIDASLLETNFHNLHHFYEHFKAHPQNRAYFNSVLARLPINNKMAAFGSTPSGDKWVPGSVDEFTNSSGVFRN
jgi:glutathione S-transferase